jgi:hypothetical protein
MERLEYFIFQIGVILMINKLKNILIYHLKNIFALFNRTLAEAGFGGGILNGWTELEIRHIRDGKVIKTRKVYDRVVTTAFVNDVVDSLKGDAGPYGTFNDYKYHASGTGTANESVSDTALGTEVESRVTGSQEEGATANIYKSIGTVTYTGAHAVTEHGLFNASSGGTLADRTKFPAVNVISGDSIQFTFTMEFQAGG